MPNRKKAKATKTSHRRRIDTSRVQIRFLVNDNPRRATTKAGKRFAALRKAASKKRNATARELMKASGYRGDDLQWDIAHKNVKLVAKG